MLANTLYLVTGGTGFLGWHVIKLLLKQGARVRVFARNPSSELNKLGKVEFSRGSIADIAALTAAAKGVDGIFHLAGLVIHSRLNPKELFDTNLTGTMNVMKAAKEAKVRVVYASTSGTVGCSKDPQYVANDESPYCEEIAQHWPYYQSKIDSEKQAFDYARKNKLELIAMRPTMMFGPEDMYLRGTKLIVSFLERHIPFAPSGGVSFVDVRDVAQAFVTAMTKGTPGQTYLLGAKNCSLRDFFQILEDLSGVAKPRLRLPAAVAKSASFTLDLINRKIKGKWDPGVDPVRAEMATHFWSIDSSKAIEELNFDPRDPLDTLNDTLNWIRENNITLASSPGPPPVPKAKL